MPLHTPAAGPWGDALQRATEATAARSISGMDEMCWDDVAMRNIVAVVFYALHLRDREPVESISWNAVLWQLRDDRQVAALITRVLPEAGHDLARTAAPGDPVAETWRWLTRTWDPHAPTKGSSSVLLGHPHHAESGWGPDAPEPRWGGMSRGIGGLPDPALEVCTHWAAGVVQTAIITEHGGHQVFDRVEVTAGAFEGQRGYVRDSGWIFDDGNETVEGPAGYVVDLDDVEGTVDIDADQLQACADLRWADRPAGTLKASPPPGLGATLPPRTTCAEDLAEILDRASNAEIVPAELRRTIGAATEHHHLELDWQASPSPHRVTWRVLQHWYQLGAHYADDQRADVFEVVVTRHLHDPEPVHRLALSEEDVAAVVARCSVLD
ncbi:hypothetical protein GCM10010211_20590 [Streptomyces albospinus]|uniref:Uncharacterized protein n=1 Tax=Streptomyces albospinus TaxID=285515 RepID=A0ABQ2UZG9_9ACTN|nr:hypothetical protein [Streptomyces albospinus]GGU55694.1 hypothetical protein GCM10010211_20590 [Streptomyces albospinus]